MNLPEFVSNHVPWFLLALIPLVLIGQIWFMCIRMSKPENMMVPMPAGPSPFRQPIIAAHQTWLNANALEFAQSFRFGSIEVAVFQQRGTQPFFHFIFSKPSRSRSKPTSTTMNAPALTHPQARASACFLDAPVNISRAFPASRRRKLGEDIWRRKHIYSSGSASDENPWLCPTNKSCSKRCAFAWRLSARFRFIPSGHSTGLPSSAPAWPANPSNSNSRDHRKKSRCNNTIKSFTASINSPRCSTFAGLDKSIGAPIASV